MTGTDPEADVLAVFTGQITGVEADAVLGVVLRARGKSRSGGR